MHQPLTNNIHTSPARESLAHLVWHAAARFPERPALWVDGQTCRYQDLIDAAARIAGAILAGEVGPRPLVATLAYRSITAYAGVLGILAAGKGYVPLHPHFPAQRNREMLIRSGARMLVIGREAIDVLPEILAGVSEPLVLIFPDTKDRAGLVQQYPLHTVAGVTGQGADYVGPPLPLPVEEDGTAYLLFTSGSTGIPKGVPVSHRNVLSYATYIRDRYEVNEQDRLSQTFDQTFDLSVHDMFVSWSSGACLYCLPRQTLMGPGKFIREHELTLWFSVPSVVMLMAQLRMLKPGLFPSLRYSLFCGEPLPVKSASLWQEAAPNSAVDNLYGPTEATIAISAYRWNAESTPQESVGGIVPIGWIFPGQEGAVVDADGNVVADGEKGELLLSGTQVTGGYLNDPEKTRQQYVRLDNSPTRIWYRTGDLVQRSETGCLVYLGRIDDQVKVHGHRVELQEIDRVLRDAAGIDLAVSVAWSPGEQDVKGIYGFVATSDRVDEASVLACCRETLPFYMVPERIYFIGEMPLNANGKIDRKALADRIPSLK